MKSLRATLAMIGILVIAGVLVTERYERAAGGPHPTVSTGRVGVSSFPRPVHKFRAGRSGAGGTTENFHPEVRRAADLPSVQPRARERDMPAAPGLADLFRAIRHVESGGDDLAIGDGGRSRGPYQISRAYWTDANVRWSYDDAVWDRRKSEYVMYRYWQRYAPDALNRVVTSSHTVSDLEALARLHNGGPDGADEPETLSYWRRVAAELQQGRK